jgi:Phosphoinositide 3-kinase C2
VLQEVADIPIERNDYTLRYAVNNPNHQIESNSNTMYSWIINKPFQVQLHSVQNLVVSKGVPMVLNLQLQLGLFHGGKSLCQTKKIDVRYWANETGICECEEIVTFDIDLNNLPRMARLCVAICEKKANDFIPMGWFNTMVYNYQDTLKTYKSRKFNTWKSFGNNQWFNSLGTVEQNTAEDQVNVVMSTVT